VPLQAKLGPASLPLRVLSDVYPDVLQIEQLSDDTITIKLYQTILVCTM
jgi:hypothetical protein